MKVRKKKLNQKQSNQKGITLIALVITIVVMLILAGVTINLTLGENGIFTTAQQATKNYTEGQNKEQENLAYFTNTVDNIAKGNTTLTGQITGADYGKYINYSVTVEDMVLDKWRVFYNDKTTGNVYIILDGYLPNTLIPEETGMLTTGIYGSYWQTKDNAEMIDILKNTTYWNTFARGVTGATAYGGSTKEMFVKSWNENPIVNSTILSAEDIADNLIDSSKMYIPYTQIVEECWGYWLIKPYEVSTHISTVACNGKLNWGGISDGRFCLRPIVSLPSEITGTIGTSVNIEK